MSNWQSDSFLLLLCHKISALQNSIFTTPVRDEKGQNISFEHSARTCTTPLPSHIQQPEFAPQSEFWKRAELTGKQFCQREGFPPDTATIGLRVGLQSTFLFHPLPFCRDESDLNKMLKRIFNIHYIYLHPQTQCPDIS